MNPTLDQIARRLAEHRPILLPPGNGAQAAVAFILRNTERGPEGLFIERATRDGDPWSGNVGLPGGRVEKEDGSLRETAERETREEIGLDLSRRLPLGRLSDIAGAHLPVRVACFVYLVTGEPPLLLSDEVTEAFWVSLAALTAPGTPDHSQNPVPCPEYHDPGDHPPTTGQTTPLGNNLPPGE